MGQALVRPFPELIVPDIRQLYLSAITRPLALTALSLLHSCLPSSIQYGGMCLQHVHAADTWALAYMYMLLCRHSVFILLKAAPSPGRCCGQSTALLFFFIPCLDDRWSAAGASAIVALSDGDAVQKACKEAANEPVNFVWTQFRGLGTFLGARAQHKREAAAASTKADAAPAHAAGASRDNESAPAMGKQHQRQQSGSPPSPTETDAVDLSSANANQQPSVSSSAPQQSPAGVPSQVPAGCSNPSASSQLQSAPAQLSVTGPETGIAQQHQRVECSIQEEVRHHAEVHEVAEGENNQSGQRKRQHGTESKIVHQHSMTVTKKRRIVDETQKTEAVAAPELAVKPEAEPVAAAEANGNQQHPPEGINPWSSHDLHVVQGVNAFAIYCKQLSFPPHPKNIGVGSQLWLIALSLPGLEAVT